MPTTNMVVHPRPLRVGLLVRSGEVGDLVEASGISTLLWGGIRNPIIPVGTEEEGLPAQLLGLFQVDVLHPVGSSDAIETFLEDHSLLRSPRLHGLYLEDWRTKKNELSHLDSINVIQKYWDEEFRHASEDKLGNAIHPSWDGSDELSEVLAISFGFYPDHLNLKDDFTNAFTTGLRASEIHVERGAIIPEELVTAVHPMALTGLRLYRRGGSHRDHSGLYFGNPTDCLDLTYFWNLRAAGNDTVFVPVTAIDRFENVIRAHLSRLDERPNRHPTIEDYIVMSYRDDEATVSKIMNRFETKKRKILSRYSTSSWNGSNVRPATFDFGSENLVAFVDYEFGRYTVTVSLPEKRFLPDDPSRDISAQQLAVSISPLADVGYPGHTLGPPFRRDLNEYYSREISFSPSKIRSERGGIGVLIDAYETSIRLRPIPKKAVVEKLLSLSGVDAEMSQPGLLAERLLEKLGGVDGARIFKIRGVRNLVSSLGVQATVSKGSATFQIYNGGQFHQHRDLYIEPREKPYLTTGAVFNFLLRMEFFRAGLELTCDRCRLVGWHSLRQIDDTFVCEFCGHGNQTSLHLQGRGDWKFRKSGLLSKENNQEGAIPVVLSLLVFKRAFDLSGLMYSTSLDLNVEGQRCEIDFMIVRRHRESGIEWALGEAKSEGGQIDENDIQNLMRVKAKLEAINVAPHLVFSKTADLFQPAELELLKALKEDASVILLTNKEMEPYDPYDDTDGLPHKHVSTFDEMARNSEHRYLR